MKIVSWNVNSLRARLDQVLDWIEANQPDVMCFQETKLPDKEFPQDEFGDLNYDVVFQGERAYNGVAIASKAPMAEVWKGLPGDAPDANRRIVGATIEGIRVVSVYVPNGQSLDSDKYPYKLDWMARLLELIKKGPPPSAPLIVCGDYNLAPADIDCWDPRVMEGGTHVSPPERAAFQALLEWGMSDAFRQLYPDRKAFTWWDYRAGGFQKNQGLRIDHFLVTEPIMKRTRSVSIDIAARRGSGASDHAPVILELE